MLLDTGFWDESENLDRELSLFVAGTWTSLYSPSSNEPYYYNQVCVAKQANFHFLLSSLGTPQSPCQDVYNLCIHAEKCMSDRVLP